MVPRYSHRRRLQRTRRGLSTVTLLIVAVILMLSCGIALDTALIGYKQQQLEGALESAARSGASQLLNPPPRWFDDPYRVATAADAFQERRRGNSSWRVELARQQAVRFAALNVESGRSVHLDRNSANDPEGEIVTGWMNDPGDPFSRFVLSRNHCNTVRVQQDRSRLGGNPLTTWFLSKVGLLGVDREIAVTAHLDQRIHGFRPRRGVNTPVVPVLARRPAWLSFEGEGEGDRDDKESDDERGKDGEDDDQARKRVRPKRQDRFTVCPPGVIRRPDGMPEYELVIPVHGETDDDREEGNATLLRLGEAGHLDEQVAHGLSPVDLAEQGGYLAAGMQIEMLPLRGGQVSTVNKLMRSIRGQRRIWPVTRWSRGQAGRVTEFAAAVVVDSYLDDRGLVVVIQPYPLLTSTAITGRGVPRNSGLGKVVLVN